MKITPQLSRAGRAHLPHICCVVHAPLRRLQNSNLVLTAEQRTHVGKEPDGSAASLWGNMAGRMGDRVERAKPEGLENKAKKRATQPDADGRKKRRVSTPAGLVPSTPFP